MNKFERTRYPDGQIGVKYIPSASPLNSFMVTERINNYEDLMYVRSIAEIMDSNHMNKSKYTLFIPCLFGQRSDRRFSDLESFDLKIITDVINECNFGSVAIFDPHSDVSLALIRNSRRIKPDDYIKQALDLFVQDVLKERPHSMDVVLVSPDAGAYKKVYGLGEKFNRPVLAAVKNRDREGNVNLQFMGDVKDKYCLIVDDLCDGGYTFEVLGQALRAQGAKKVCLYVSHGLFSKGFEKLFGVIDHIYCTNSVKDVPKFKDDVFIVGDIDNGGHFEYISDFVTQFKII